MTTFPRTPDDQGWAWGLMGDRPQEIWERFSPAYEAQAERLWTALVAAGLAVELDGAGSEDGEFIVGRPAGGGPVFFTHLEDPNDARHIAALDDAALAEWIAAETAEMPPPGD